MLRFAILKTIEDGESEVVLEYDSTQILTRLQGRVKENLAGKTSFFKRGYSKEEVEDAITKSFIRLVKEFKEKTITLR